MAEFKYALTRVCLRSGTLTLPGKMLALFPDEGTVEVLDTTSDETYALEVRGRAVGGLGPMFREHRLHVNDGLLIRPLDDGTFAITPIRHERKPEWEQPEVVAGFLDDLVAGQRPLTEPEIRAMYPYVPADVDLDGLLGSDGRFARVEGRWRTVAGGTQVGSSMGEGHGAGATGDDAAEGWAPAAAGSAAGSRGAESEAAGTARRPAVHEAPAARPSVADAGLNSEQAPADLRAVRRARATLERVGFRVEGLGHGQLMAVAELGRRSYKALVYTLPEGERLDWASLLERRRDSGAKYLAVFGEHRDLIRLQAPAELARATLWSWPGMQRMLDLTRTVLVSPVDLESHFERDGLFEHGLERFEDAIERRIEERGAFSSVLTRLAAMRAPAIFLLEDLVVDMDLQREQVLRILERLGEAPFHLVAHVDSGEFCLRYRVSDALTQLSEYALSLRERLPDRRRDRIAGFASTDDDSAPELVGVRPRHAPTASLAVPLFEDDTPYER